MPSRKLSQVSAMLFWRENLNNEDVDWDRFEAAETFLMKHPPASPDEAADLLEVITAQDGPRSDGLDHTALKRVMEFLRYPVKAELRPQALSRSD